VAEAFCESGGIILIDATTKLWISIQYVAEAFCESGVVAS
jgi:hypothetical protein